MYLLSWCDLNYIISFSSASNAFRHLYQGFEAVVLHGDIRNGTPPTYIQTAFFSISKLGIAALDVYSTHLNRFLVSPSNDLKVVLNISEVSFRFIDLCRGAYLLRTDPSVDRDYIKQTAILNLINIYCLSMDTLRITLFASESHLFQYVVHICNVFDTAIRLHSLIDLQTKFQVIRNITLNQVMQTIDGIARTVLTGLVCYLICNCAKKLLAFHMENINEISVLVMLTAFLTLLVIPGYVYIYDSLGAPASNHDPVVFICSLMTGVVLSTATASGLGFSRSIKEITMNYYHAVFTLALLSTVAYFFKSSIHFLFESAGFQQSNRRTLAEWSFTILTSVPLCAVASVGFGLSQSPSDFFTLIFKIARTNAGLFFCVLSCAPVLSIIEKKPKDWEALIGTCMILGSGNYILSKLV